MIEPDAHAVRTILFGHRHRKFVNDMGDPVREPENATVSIDWGSKGDCTRLDVYLDGKSIARLRDFTQSDFTVAPGSHEMRVEDIFFRSNGFRFDLASGTTIRLETGELLGGRRPSLLWRQFGRLPGGLYLGRVGELESVIKMPTNLSFIRWLVSRWIRWTSYSFLFFTGFDWIRHYHPSSGYIPHMALWMGIGMTVFGSVPHWKSEQKLKLKLLNDRIRRRAELDNTVWPPSPKKIAS
jgi:hypothetical protein